MTNAAGTGFQNVRLLVKEAPSIHAYDAVNFYIGVQNNYPVQTTGFPKLPEQFGTTNPVTLHMDVSVSGALPPAVSFGDTNQFGIPTGTGVLAGMPVRAPAADPRGILFLILALLAVAALGFRRRRWN